MRRLLLLVLLTVLGVSILVWVAGGLEGPGTRRASPEVDDTGPTQHAEMGFVAPLGLPVTLDEWKDSSLPAPPEPIRFTDPNTGESVLIPDFIPWFIELERGARADSSNAGSQSLEVENVEIVMWRRPRTLEEARALAQGVEGARDSLVNWRITAPRGRVCGLGLAVLRGRPDDTETVVELSGGVRIIDLERHMVIEGKTIEVHPHLDRIRGSGRFVVRHEAFELTGEGLEIERRERETRLVVLRDTLVHLYGDLPGPDGRPVLDLGTKDFLPGHLAAEGGAVLVHRIATDSSREDLTLELTNRVHAEQTNGRSLDAERVHLSAWLSRGEATSGSGGSSRKRWNVKSFEADGGVLVEYPGRTEEGSPYLLSASARRLVHEVAPDHTSTTLLEGNPELTLHGDIPLEGLSSAKGAGRIHASASEQAWLGPASAADVPEGKDPNRYHRLILRGNARLEYRGTGLDPTMDALEGEQMTVLLREMDEEEALPAKRNSSRVVAVSFAMLGGVHLSGTRMSGMTHRLVAEDLDTDAPVLIAEGPGTSFAFHGLGQDERLLGGGTRDEKTLPSTRGTGGSKAVDRTPEWVLARLLARGDALLQTTFGGPSLGLSAHLEGAEIGYERVSDRAWVRGGHANPARLAVGEPKGVRQRLEARTFRLDRARGAVTAEGSVKGVVFLASTSDGAPTSDALALPPRQLGVPTTLGVATNGRIEIRTRVTALPWQPRLDVEQVILIEGRLVAELTAETLEVDRLRADRLELAFMQTVDAASHEPAAPTMARAFPPHTPGPTPSRSRVQRPAGTVKPTRWDLETERLTARFGPRGIESVEASDGVHISSQNSQIRGTSLRYEVTTRQLRILGDHGGWACASFGPAENLSEVRATELVLTMGKKEPSSLLARGPTLATLLRRDEKTGPDAIERFDVLCRGDVEMTPTSLATLPSPTIATDAAVEIRRHLRRHPGARWESPFRLWSDHVVVTGHDLLSHESADVRTVVASGLHTTLQAGEGKDMTTIWGDRFELDVASSTATLAGGPNGDLRIRRGTADHPLADSEQSKIVFDLNTGTIHDLEHARVILRGVR